MYNYFYIHQRYKNIGIKYQENGIYYYANRFLFLIGCQSNTTLVMGPSDHSASDYRGDLLYPWGPYARDTSHPASKRSVSRVLYFFSLPFHLPFSLCTYLVTDPFVLSTPRQHLWCLMLSRWSGFQYKSPPPEQSSVSRVKVSLVWARTCDGETCYARVSCMSCISVAQENVYADDWYIGVSLKFLDNAFDALHSRYWNLIEMFFSFIDIISVDLYFFCSYTF